MAGSSPSTEPAATDEIETQSGAARAYRRWGPAGERGHLRCIGVELLQSVVQPLRGVAVEFASLAAFGGPFSV